MATAKKTQIVITANAAVAKKVMDELQQRIDGIKQRMAALDVTTAQGAKEFKKLEKELVSYNSAVTQNVTNTELIDKAMKNLAGTSLNELKRALSAAKSELGKMSANDNGLKQMQSNVKVLQSQIDKLTQTTRNHGNAWQTATKNLTAYVGMFSAFNMLKSKLTDILKLNFSLSDQLADIRKVSGWAMKDVDELSKRLAKIDTRNSIQQLNNLAYEGAKLGIGKYGVDGLERFAEATAQIRMALHEDMGDEAIGQLAKMAEVMHDIDNMGVSQSLLASGSAIFKLAATTTSTGTNIMEFSKRLLGLGKTADLTTPQILALGSAADTMALMPEVASTAFNKFITTLQSKYGQVAKAVGMNQERLKSLLDQHQTMQAIVEVLEHMRGMGDLNALAPIMGDLGSEGARLTNVFASMAANVEMLKEQLATSEEEFQKATAVTAEFDIQNETAQAMMERANNIWEKSFVNSDNAAGGIKDIANAWYEMTKAITDSVSFMTEAKLLLASLTFGIKTLIGALPALISGLVYFGAAKIAAWAQWPVIINAVAVALGRAGVSMLNFVGIHTASQKAAIATAYANQTAAESMYAEALSAKNAAISNQAFATTQEEVAAANAAVAAANADLIAAQQILATSTMELSTATGASTTSLLAESESKILDSASTGALSVEDTLLASSKGVTTAMTEAETAAVAKETAAKEANATATKNMRLAWGAIVFISLIALVDKLYGNLKKLNEEEERQEEITDKIAGGLATANKEYEDACKNLKVLYDELQRNWNQMDERKRLIGEINTKYGEYADNLVDETTKISELSSSYNDATDSLREYYYYKQKEALRSELVNEEQHKGDVSFMRLQNMGGDYQNKITLDLAKSAIKEYATVGASAADIATNIWKDFFNKKDVPGNYYMDLSKLPLIGGMFPKNTFRSNEQEAMSYLYDFVKSYVIAMNNEANIDKNFPGEWTPPKRKDKSSVDSSKGNAEKPEDDARANISEFITKIKNFYERQMTALIEDLTAKNVEKELQDQAVDAVRQRMYSALAAAQQSLVLGSTAWENFKSSMDEDLKERDDEYGQSQSRTLKDAVQSTDVKKLRTDLLAQMPKIKKGEVVGLHSDESDRAYLDRMWLSASKDEKKEVTVDQKRMEARRKELMEHTYTGAVKENVFLGLVNVGYANVDLDRLEDDKKDVFNVLERARNDMGSLFSTDGEKDKLLTFLFGEGYKDTPRVFSSLLDLSDEDVKLFYRKLIQYSDEYTAAQKKQYDDAKKYSAQMWAVNNRNLAQQKQIRDIQNESNLYGRRTNYWSNLGLANVTADPEVELMKTRMRAAEDYYAFIEKNYRNKQLLQEADVARQKAELAYANQMATAMKSRLSQMKELVQPIEAFGEAMGEALATMRTDAESANEAIKSALKSMLMSWGKMAINDVNTQMWKAINDAGAKRGINNAKGDIDAARASANADVTTANISTIGTAGNPAHVIVDSGIPGTAGATNGATGGINGSTKNATGNATGNTAGEGASPARAWLKRNRYNVIGGANGASGATGVAVADAVTGNGDLINVGARVLGEAGNALLNTPMIGGGSSVGSEGGGEGGSAKDDKAAARQRRKEEKERKKQLKAERKHQKDLTRETKKGLKDREKETDKGIGNMSAVTEAGNEEQSKSTEIAQGAMMSATQTALTTNLAATQQNNDETLKSDAARTQGEVTFSIAGAMAKCFEFLGPIAGPIAASVVMATLMGLLQWALSSALGGSKSSSSSSSGTNTKLKTGMLTYDSGNVQDLKPFVGDNGEMYWATEDNVPNSGVNLLSSPTATTINGQRSLVAENGPELVIGRETTKAMMMNNPALLKALVNYDSNYSGRSAARRTFDEGNVAEVAIANSAQLASAAQQSASDATNAALLQAVSALMSRLEQPITAQINMFGRGQLYESMNKANQFMKGK